MVCAWHTPCTVVREARRGQDPSRVPEHPLIEHTIWRGVMTMRFDSPSVPATDKVASATCFAGLSGVTVTPDHVAPRPVNESLTLGRDDIRSHIVRRLPHVVSTVRWQPLAAPGLERPVCARSSLATVSRRETVARSVCAVTTNYTHRVTRIGFGGYPIGQPPYLMPKG